jgi:hypothetical protein
MKTLAVIASLALGCQGTPSKLDGNIKPVGSARTGNVKLEAALTKIDERLKALETSHKIGGGEKLSAAERVHRIEASLARREEALGFLELAYSQQKKQLEAQEANEHDPSAIFAVDISGPIKAGQVEGPNSAIVTVVEAWDFA